MKALCILQVQVIGIHQQEYYKNKTKISVTVSFVSLVEPFSDLFGLRKHLDTILLKANEAHYKYLA